MDCTEREAVIELRAALRTTVAHLAGETRVSGLGIDFADPLSPANLTTGDVEAALTVINECASAAPTGHLVLVEGQVQRRSAAAGSSVQDVLAAIALEATELFLGPDVEHLRACHGPRCVLYFTQDHPRRQWCSPACGNRARAARHYRRHREDATS
jgi:predicted RNA-binding Zn ribbon-like protein